MSEYDKLYEAMQSKHPAAPAPPPAPGLKRRIATPAAAETEPEEVLPARRRPGRPIELEEPHRHTTFYLSEEQFDHLNEMVFILSRIQRSRRHKAIDRSRLIRALINYAFKSYQDDPETLLGLVEEYQEE